MHLALAYCEGTVTPSTEIIDQSFEELGDGYCGTMEDPSEDLFVSLVGTQAGNFRVFEGVWEGAAFHLQRILDIVEGMPNRPFFNQIRSSVESLLRLSDAVAERAGMPGNVLGQATPLDKLPAELADRLSTVGQLIRFNTDELARLKLSKASLSEFVLSTDARDTLRKQFIGHSELERRPVFAYGGHVYLLLPTAVVPAITRFLIESVVSKGLGKAFEQDLSNKFGQLFYGNRHFRHSLGGSGNFPQDWRRTYSKHY